MVSGPEKTVSSHDGISPVKSGGNRGADEGDDNSKPTHPIVEDKLRRALSPRQVQMIAIGGTIG